MYPADYIDRHRPTSCGACAIVRIPTVNPPGEHYDVITAFFGAVSPARVCRRGATGFRRLCSGRNPAARTDGFPRYNVLGKLAVPAHADDPFQRPLRRRAGFRTWRHGGPFSGAVADGWIYGRGTADMKGSIASLLLALQALRATGTSPRLNVEVSFTADEETDSLLGAGWLVRHALRRARLCGRDGRRRRQRRLLRAQRGGLAGSDRARPGRPRLAARDRRQRPGKDVRPGARLRGLQEKAGPPHFPHPRRPDHAPTLNVGGVFTCGEGAKINTVPAHASFTIDRRVLPIESHAAAERDLRAFLTAAPEDSSVPHQRCEGFGKLRLLPPAQPSLFCPMAASVRRVRRSRRFSVSTGSTTCIFLPRR